MRRSQRSSPEFPNSGGKGYPSNIHARGIAYTLLGNAGKYYYMDFLAFVPIKTPKIDGTAGSFSGTERKSGGLPAREDFQNEKDSRNSHLQQLLALQKADFGSKGVDENEDPFTQTEMLLSEILAENDCLTAKDLAITGNDILGLGFAPGPQIGSCMTYLLQQVQDENLPNEKNALLDAAKAFLEA